MIDVLISVKYIAPRIWKTSDDTGAVTVAQARQRARAMLAAYRNCGSAEPGIENDALFETVAREVLVHHERLWKPGTLEVNRKHLRRQTLPFFAGRMISATTRQDVAAWFRSLHATAAAANRSAPVLSVITQKAEAWAYRPENSNLCAGIRRYRETRRERILLPEEYRILADVLAPHQSRCPLQTDAMLMSVSRKRNCNYSPLVGVWLSVVLVEDVCGLSVEGDVDGDVRVVAECVHGGEVA